MAVWLLIVLATLAFGAVYPWAYLPLFAAAACLGIVGLVHRRGIPAETRGICLGVLLLAAAVGLQLIPIPRTVLDHISPHAANLLSRYNLAFAGGSGSHALSVAPSATGFALLGLAGLGIYTVGLPGLLSSRDLHRLPRNLIVFAVLLALIGIFGREHNNGLVYGFWQPEEGTNGNGFGPFVNRNHFAGWMLMVTCLSIGALLGQIEVARQSVKPGTRNSIVWFSTREANRIILMAAAIAVMGISLVWTLSRSGIVGFACAVLCFAWLVARRRYAGKTRRIVGFTMLTTLLVASVNWRGANRLVEWFGDTNDLVSRFAAWRDGWRVVRDFTVAGTGINTYPTAMIFYQKNVLSFWMTHAHNDYLQLIAEGGLLVCLPAVVAVILLATAIRRRMDEVIDDSYGYWIRSGASVGLIAIAIQETVEFSLHIPANAFLFATLAAVAVSKSRRVGADPTHGLPRSVGVVSSGQFRLAERRATGSTFVAWEVRVLLPSLGARPIASPTPTEIAVHNASPRSTAETVISESGNPVRDLALAPPYPASLPRFVSTARSKQTARFTDSSTILSPVVIPADPTSEERLGAPVRPSGDIVVRRPRDRCAECHWAGWKRRLGRRSDSSGRGLRPRNARERRAVWFFVAARAS